MVIDIHIHMAGPPDDAGASPLSSRARPSLVAGLLMRAHGMSADDLDARDGKDAVARKVLSWIGSSGLDLAVLLALDGARDGDGRPIPGIPNYCIGNVATSELARQNRRILFGASVHPYRTDAVTELERLVARGACLVKWLPSAQRIDPEDRRCLPFYEALAHLNLPLLSHTGIEHTLRGGDHRFNHPAKLAAALERGVTVIAAHCGKRVFLHEACFFGIWKRMALAHERFFGDLGAFLVPTRLGALREIVRTPALASKILYGSDFPMVPWTPGLSLCTGRMRAKALRAVKNPFDRPWMTLEALGVPETVFTRAAGILRIPAEKLRLSAALAGACR